MNLLIMKKITIYSTSICNYCYKAKKLLEEEGYDFDEILIDNNEILKNQMIEKTKGKTSVPQIFFDDVLVGGYDDLSNLKFNGLLKTLINDN